MAKVTQIEQQDIDYSSTLEQSDLGTWSVLGDSGTFHMMNNEDAAHELCRQLNAPVND